MLSVKIRNVVGTNRARIGDTGFFEVRSLLDIAYAPINATRFVVAWDRRDPLRGLQSKDHCREGGSTQIRGICRVDEASIVSLSHYATNSHLGCVEPKDLEHALNESRPNR